MYQSALGAWARGDLFIAATALNDAEDDHKGRGRILHYGSDLQPKGVLWLKDTTHLVGGLKFDPQGVLWAFDSMGFVILNIKRDGTVIRRKEFGARPFSHVNFADDGSLLLAEHAFGDTIRPEIQSRMKTVMPFMPGTQRFGDGHVFRFSDDGQLIAKYATEVHGGMGGFLGVTMSVISSDQKTLVYCTETGPRLMRYDLVSNKQLPDLQGFSAPYAPGPPPMFFAMEYSPDGLLYVLRGRSIHVINARGITTREIALEGYGWALMDLSKNGAIAFTSNFITGEIAKIDLNSGAKLGGINTGEVRSVAGLVEYQGEGL